MEKTKSGCKEYKIKLTDVCDQAYYKLTKKNDQLKSKADKDLVNLKMKKMSGEKLTANLEGLLSYHFKMHKEKRQYRIVYAINKKTCVITVWAIAPRSSVYKILEKQMNDIKRMGGIL